MAVGILARMRLDLGYSQRDLAAVARVDRNTVKDLERDPPRRPHPKTVRKLAMALGCTPAALAYLYQEEVAA